MWSSHLRSLLIERERQLSAREQKTRYATEASLISRAGALNSATFAREKESRMEVELLHSNADDVQLTEFLTWNLLLNGIKKTFVCSMGKLKVARGSFVSDCLRLYRKTIQLSELKQRLAELWMKRLNEMRWSFPWSMAAMTNDMSEDITLWIGEGEASNFYVISYNCRSNHRHAGRARRNDPDRLIIAL